MSAKKPWFKARTAWFFKCPDSGNKNVGGICGAKMESSDIRIRITDAREITAEKAVERVLQFMESATIDGFKPHIGAACASIGMTATVKNGKVTVRRGKR